MWLFFSSQLFRTEAFVQNSSNGEKNDDNAPYDDAQEPSFELAGEVGVTVLDAAAIGVSCAPAGGQIIYSVHGVVGKTVYCVASVFGPILDTPCLEMALVLFRNKNLRRIFTCGGAESYEQ